MTTGAVLGGVHLRPATEEDLEAVEAGKHRAFTDLAARFATTPPPPPTDGSHARGLARLRTFLATPSLAQVAVDDDGRLLGGAFAAVREGLWYLSLLYVEPDRHSAGVGRRLMDAVTPPEGAGLIAASPDARALRLYAAHGFMPLPVLRADGPVRTPPPPQPEVVEGSVEDLEAFAALDRRSRGAARTEDLPLLAGHGARVRVLPGRGYAITVEHVVLTVSAADVEAAAILLRDALAGVPAGREPDVRWIRGDQPWAVAVLVEAGLGLRTEGAVCVRDVALSPAYLSSGAHL